MSTYPPCSEVTFNLYKEEEEDERHKRQTLKFAHFLCCGLDHDEEVTQVLTMICHYH